ncbi:TIGR00730 family Rossman fold protein [Luteimonas terricola]|uniref:Cytokinin riboside 5'-monophosphate phosphoribohydrolase n=1 Tax=Luteimonas terricola TaxID=645597 RepID=A0ABQ2EB94_9GAMM|nr:TIGR00730 family Rossman fold protein [Luteimonas terricola]GGK04886.1 cytokinin riboside 5'-monophosphate phosphoribohydrolase [Luteimonas terricola]
MKSLCVYCGSNSGARPAYAEGAIALGTRMARDGIRLVYGGGNIGLMGTIADAVLAAGGEVVGVIPKQLVDMEVAHLNLTELEVVGSMHERKSRMFDLADGFVALPGGFGTLEEIVEMLTWRQLGIGNKPCAILDIEGYYQPLVAMMDRMVEERFLHPGQRDDLWTGQDIGAMIDWMRGYQPAQASKWLDEKRSRELR